MIIVCVMLSAAIPADDQENKSVDIPVIMYHSITAVRSTPWIISPAALEEDLRYLSQNGYTAVFAEDLIEYVYGEGMLPKKPVLLTFDDGMQNNLDILPLLEKYDMRIVLSIIGETSSEDPEHSAHLSWDGIRRMLDSGRVEIANHTWGLHKNDNGRCGCMRKKGEDLDEYRKLLATDVSRMQREIFENLGVIPMTFTYPFGAKCDEALDILKELGFLVTLSCHGGASAISPGSYDSLFDLKRNNREPGKSARYFIEEYMR
ncbi:MAG: polysaccharide deacetylase family protein [Oscillospiraceae bacterium]|nr:polysaccharide deacetylase family protein [Oscillospiraceae bacterium]